MMINIILCVALFVSLITDLTKRKILNVVTFPAIIVGLFYYLFTNGLTGFLFSVKGLLIGLCLLLVPYLLGGMGAGDVKLMAAIGALRGGNFVFYSFLYTALIGGVIALVLIVKKKGIVQSLNSISYKLTFLRRSNQGSIVLPNKEVKHSSISFPYGVAIVLGTLCNLIWGGF